MPANRNLSNWSFAAVNWMPGWDSVAGAGWWSGFYFWLSIACLIGLGVAEVASHRYSERRDQLSGAEQREIQHHHDEEMTAVQHDTALANERAAELEKEAATAKLRLQELQTHAEPRVVNVLALSKLLEGVSPVPVEILVPETDGECWGVAMQLKLALEKLGWPITGPSPIQPNPALSGYPPQSSVGGQPMGVAVVRRGKGSDQYEESGAALAEAVNASLNRVYKSVINPEAAIAPPEGTVRIVVGAKP
jgi:hypothetical protein